MRLGLMFAQGQNRRVPAVRLETGGVVDRQAGVVAERGTRDAMFLVLVIPRTPLAGEITLRESAAMSLSGGERRRCEIARALAAVPSIMLLDEPFAGIDPISIADIRELVRELKSRDIGVLITDHNVRETLDIVDRACIIYDGQVLFQGTPEALVADQEVRRLYLGESFAL
jgi:ABC-type glutathione transport system ATPase component